MKIKIFDEFIDKYNNTVSDGKIIAKNKKVCITALARNIEKYLPETLSTLDQIGKLFYNAKYLIYENDSKDNTKYILEDWSNRSSDHYLISENLNASHPCGPSSKSTLRTQALASYRNKCKSYISQHLSDSDFILVIDLDFIFYNIDGLFHSIGYMSHNSHIDAMAGFSYLMQNFNRSFTNYDSWAYRHTWWSDHQSLMPWFGIWFPFVGSDPFKVNSAFGGSVLYSSKMYLSSDYDGYDCEHVCFHKNIHDSNTDFNLYINPSQIMVM